MKQRMSIHSREPLKAGLLGLGLGCAIGLANQHSNLFRDDPSQRTSPTPVIPVKQAESTTAFELESRTESQSLSGLPVVQTGCFIPPGGGPSVNANFEPC